MLATKSWIYLDLEKTGCTTLRSVLLKLYPENLFIEKRKHSLQLKRNNLPKIITVRDPYKYYFSLWRYGLDQKGGIYNQLKKNYPNLAKILYENASKEAFSKFLDYVLHSPTRYVAPHRFDWLPFSLDLYTSRILSMIVPIQSRLSFLNKLGTDLPSSKILLEAASPYMPEVIIRTTHLNSDFHRLADKGALDFLNLPIGWQKIFHRHYPAQNRSTAIINDSINDYFLPGWKKLIEKKCSLSLLMLNMGNI